MTRVVGFGVLLASVSVAVAAHAESNSVKKAYGPPGRFEKEISAFEVADRKAFPPTGAIVCLGSSSMRMWHPTIKEDLSPLTVIPRGFGGSTMDEALHAADRIVVPYKPRAILLYEGDNDLASGIDPETVRDTFLALVQKVHASLPTVRIYVLSVKPSISRWKLWPKMQAANRLLAEACAKDAQLTFIDIGAAMLDAQGNPRKELYKKDNLHMMRAGYELWRDAVKPVLFKKELEFEAKK